MNANMIALVLGSAGFVHAYTSARAGETAYIHFERSGAVVSAIVRGDVVEFGVPDGADFSVRACDLEAVL